jgi:acyl-CoA thioesterase
MNDNAGSGQDTAWSVGRAMYSRDRVAQALAIELAEIRPGYARMIMRVAPDMLNGHDICHGGYIFTLADTAFAYACNSYNQVALAASCAIDFLAPGQQGDLLIATAQEQSLSGRTGIYDVVVANDRGERIAMMRGRSQKVRGEIIVKDA